MDASPPADFIDTDGWVDSHPTTTVRKLIGNPCFEPLAGVLPE